MEDILNRLIVRHGFPGLPPSIIMFLFFTRIIEVSSEFSFTLIILSASLTILFGYVAFQLWFWYFERENGALAYNSKNRKVLIEIKKKVKNNNITPDQLYSIWETLLYRKGDSDKRFEKDKKSWSEYHLNMAMAVGSYIGISLAVLFLLIILIFPWVLNGVTPTFDEDLYLPFLIFLSIVYFLSSIIFTRKAKQTRKLVESLEVFWAPMFIENLDKIKDKDILSMLAKLTKRKNA